VSPAGRVHGRHRSVTFRKTYRDVNSAKLSGLGLLTAEIKQGKTFFSGIFSSHSTRARTVTFVELRQLFKTCDFAELYDKSLENKAMFFQFSLI
jgi:hypothetical protein